MLETPRIPDREQGLRGFILRRDFKGDRFAVGLSNGDTYELSRTDLETYMRVLGVPEDFGVVDYVWNFYAAVVAHEQGCWSFNGITPFQADDVVGASMQVMF